MLSPLVACYMFFGGAGAGACLVACLLGLLTPRQWVLDSRGRVCPSRAHARFFSGVFLASLVILAIGSLCLVGDLGQPARIINLFLHPTASYISVGAFALSALLLLDLMLFLAWRRCARFLTLWMLRVALVCGIAVSCVVMTYTGLFLQSIKAVVLWSTTRLMPPLFIAASLSSGTALVVMAAFLSSTSRVFADTVRLLVKVGIAATILELCLLAVLLVLVFRSGSAGRASVESIFMGPLGLVFWVGLVFVGVLMPIVIRVFTPRQALHGVGFALATMALTGGLALRICLVEAGTNPLVMLGVG